MIASIAAQEYALAMIINCEGEKIQRMIQMANTPQELLDINECARQLIGDLTDLERAIVDALDRVTCLCGCSDGPKMNPDDVCGDSQ
ncbi:hypothetical protein AGMMS49992_03240 [Clostridia bacterium]|nr:hypothetical protein AGMMS49992_03240 [Clostridia bacterium]